MPGKTDDFENMEGVFGINEGDETVGKRENRTKFKAKEGEGYRISIAWWPIKDGLLDLDAKTPFFIGEKRSFISSVGYFFDKGPEYAKLAGKPGRQAIATILVKWPTDKRGVLDKQRFANGDYEVMPWIFSGTRYNEIKEQHEEWGLGKHDLKLTCTDTQYQKMTIMSTKDSCLAIIMESPKRTEQAKAISQEIAELAQSMRRELGQDLTLDQIRERMGQDVASAAPASSEMNMDEVDDMINDLLEE